MDSLLPAECCCCGVPIGCKGGEGGSQQSTSGLWVCFRRRCWKQHEAVFCPDNPRLLDIVQRRRDLDLATLGKVAPQGAGRTTT